MQEDNLAIVLFQAGKLALDRGWAINIGGGFHHCSEDRGGGFCAYADISGALKTLYSQQLIGSALIIDLDAHQVNKLLMESHGDFMSLHYVLVVPTIGILVSAHCRL